MQYWQDAARKGPGGFKGFDIGNLSWGIGNAEWHMSVGLSLEPTPAASAQDSPPHALCPYSSFLSGPPLYRHGQWPWASEATPASSDRKGRVSEVRSLEETFELSASNVPTETRCLGREPAARGQSPPMGRGKQKTPIVFGIETWLLPSLQGIY